MSLLNLCMQLRHALVIKRYLAADQDIENNAKTPNINLGPGVLLRLEQLRSGKIQTTTERLQLASRRKQIAQTEVDNLDVPSLTDKNVLNLQVAVDDAIPMAVVQRTSDLTSEFAGLLLL